MTNTNKQPCSVGAKFGRLTITALAGKGRDGSNRWSCLCECGNQTNVPAFKLRNGHTSSCGCLSRELAKTRATKHGDSGSRLFNIWSGMISRCTNPKSDSWKHYGGRGITVCQEWLKDYASFKRWAESSGYAPDLTIDRIDVDLGYSPENCRWATKHEQAANKRNNLRTSDGRLAIPVAVQSGVSAAQFFRRRRSGMTPDEAIALPNKRPRARLADGRLASDVAAENGIPRGTYATRIRAYGWTPEDACTIPVRGSSATHPV